MPASVDDIKEYLEGYDEQKYIVGVESSYYMVGIEKKSKVKLENIRLSLSPYL